MRRTRTAFTLIELLVVIAIIGVLLAMLVPAVQKVREASSRVACRNNLKQIGLAIHSYHDQKKALPPSRLDPFGHVTWAVLILPYLEQDNFYRQWDLQTRYYAHAASVRQTVVPIFFCPSRRPPTGVSNDEFPLNPPSTTQFPGALGDYAACAGADFAKYETAAADGAIILASFQYGPPVAGVSPVVSWQSNTRFKDIVDGLSETILVGEKHVPLTQFGQVTAGDGSLYNGDYAANSTRVLGPGNPLAVFPTESFNYNFGSYHPGLCQFVMGDGHVGSVASAMNGSVLQLFASRNDGQVIPECT